MKKMNSQVKVITVINSLLSKMMIVKLKARIKTRLKPISKRKAVITIQPQK